MGVKEANFLSKLDEVKELITKKRPRAEIARFLGIKYDTLTVYFKKYGIVYNGNQNRRGIPHTEIRKSLEDILNNKIIYSASSLKKRLIEEGLKENKCEICGISEWNGKELCLELHHKDGNHYNNNLGNLQILCPNCHSQSEHFRGKQFKVNKSSNVLVKEEYVNKTIEEIKEIAKNNIDSSISKNGKVKVDKPKKEHIKKYCEYCGKELIKKGQTKYCSYDCAKKASSKRPQLSELIEILNINNGNKSAVSRYYNVSETAVRKWIDLYKIK
jgi:DNA invertase Pin-like site-specific DNA recombinase